MQFLGGETQLQRLSKGVIAIIYAMKKRKMPCKIIKIEKEHFPALRFIGKRYTNADRVDGGYGACWREWHEKGWFSPLMALPALPDGMETSHIGFMRNSSDCDDEENFEYWIGTFNLPITNPPDGYEYIDIPESDVGVCWIYGKEREIYRQHDACVKAIQKADMSIDLSVAGSGKLWFFERYNCPRFTMPDEKSNVILDYGIFVKG
jgi:predicted transcriptional regulator YdeE